MARARVKRRYHSAVRTAAAEGTRAAITQAARKLFAARGYAATPIEAIAAEAGVSAQTIYAAFGTKRAVLESLLDAIDQDADAGGLEAVFADPDVRAQARAIAAFLGRLFTRGGDVIALAQGVGASDPAVRALERKGKGRHRRGVIAIVERWHAAGHLRRDLTIPEAVDALYAVSSHSVFVELKTAGWSRARYEAWLADAMIRLILDI